MMQLSSRASESACSFSESDEITMISVATAHFFWDSFMVSFDGTLSVKKWTCWDLNPGPSACEADVIPLHHKPSWLKGSVYFFTISANLRHRHARINLSSSARAVPISNFVYLFNNRRKRNPYLLYRG